MSEPTTDPAMEAVERTPREFLGDLRIACENFHTYNPDEQRNDEPLPNVWQAMMDADSAALAAWESDRAELSRLRARVGEVEAELHKLQCYPSIEALLVQAEKEFNKLIAKPLQDENAQLRADLAALVPLVRIGLNVQVGDYYNDTTEEQDEAARAVLAKLDAEVPRG